MEIRKKYDVENCEMSNFYRRTTFIEFVNSVKWNQWILFNSTILYRDPYVCLKLTNTNSEINIVI